MKNITTKTFTAIAVLLLCYTVSSFGGTLNSSTYLEPVATATCSTYFVNTKVTNVTCFGDNNGTAIATVVFGGTAPFTYSWTSGSTKDTITNLAVGSYTVTVTDANGCPATATAKITQPTQIRDSISKQTAVCASGGTATATVGVKGGTTPYTYIWNSTPTQAAAIATGLAVGSYTVYITDKNGCKDSAIATITLAPAMSVKITDSVQVSCFGTKTGSAGVTVSGGTPSYTYSWNTIPTQTKDTATALAAGTYTITVTDKSGCKTTAATTITQAASALTVSASSTTPASCGQSNGAAYATVNGGNIPYSFSWAASGGTNDTAKGIAAGTYTVSVTDNNGCTVKASTTVANNSTLAVGISSTTNVTPCYGGNNGSATATATGGTPAYGYSWSSGATTSTANNLVAGNYTVTVTDASGCSVNTTTTITQPTLLKDSVTATSGVSCHGDSNGTATSLASGGTPTYTYLWSNNETTATATNLKPGTYSVTATDANGCKTTKSTIIAQPTAIRDSITSTTPIACYGNTNGRVNIGVSGGTPSYTYSWAPGGSTRNRVTGGAGTYTVTIKDANGCTKIDSVTMTQPPLLVAKITDSTQVACFGSKTGSAVVTATGGTPTYTYAWATAGGTKDTATGIAAGTYTATVTDKNGCKATVSTTITQPGSAITGTVTTYGASCGKSNGSAAIHATGGTPSYTYNWTPSGGTTDSASTLAQGIYSVTVTDANGCTFSASANISDTTTLAIAKDSSFNVTPCFGDHNGRAYFSVSGGAPGYTFSWAPSGGTDSLATGLAANTYTLTATDSKGCKVSDTVIITRPTLVTAVIATPTAIKCNGGTTSVTVKANGGVGGYTYSWTPSGGSGATAAGLAAGSYTVTVVDANGCSANDSITITQPTAITDTISSTNILCFGGNNGSVTVNVAGGTPAYTYKWTPNIGSSATITNLTAGTYSVTIRDANNCNATASVSVTQPAQLRDSIVSSTNVLCFGANSGSAMVGVKGGTASYLYNWTPSGGTGSTASNLSAGSYSVTVTDANGCSGSSSIIITQPASALADSSKSIAASCGNSNGSAKVYAYGGTTGYTYSWNTGATTSNLTSISAGSYICQVTDHNGCTISPAVIVADSSTLSAGISGVSNVSCNGVCDGSVTSFAIGGSGPYSYNWAPGGQTTANATGLCAGKYTITISDTKGCISSDTITISQPTPLTVAIDSNIAGGCTNSVWAIVSGGTKPYTYNWTGGLTTDTISSLCNGTYSVTVTDANNCSANGSLSITSPTGIAQVKEANEIKLYPIPTTGRLNISLAGTAFIPEYAIVYDMTGRKLFDEKLGTHNNVITIDVSSLEQGNYILKLVSNNDNEKIERFSVVK
jgi:hypothetical protein